ncbi:MAG TPA: OmpA family protein [Pusillimonas sp.]|uniref:OmpA family protein n=1 Tax=Pusillimonas sp. TaxID=3040095 RepID=UPI002B4ACC6A|nr:OmpA family protein [Pusillimonas sp.]HLU19079.1 OmpA family protein [Pusillimonas sp.]
MREDFDSGVDSTTPVWAVFGDLMSVLLGAFVLVLVGVIAMQLQLSNRLAEEIQQRQEETERRQTLEQALARPLAEGRVTLVDGRIGISGSVLFALNSAELQEEGRQVLSSLVEPLTDYLYDGDQALMVSGFTDDQPIHGDNRRFADNWELSAQRALTVTRALIDAGIPSSKIFAAAFGSEQPISSNTDEAGRARNRRVEISPVPSPSLTPPTSFPTAGATPEGQAQAPDQPVRQPHISSRQ